jgi:hypothetical protein
MSIEQQWQGRLKENNSGQYDERNIIEKLMFYDLLFENKYCYCRGIIINHLSLIEEDGNEWIQKGNSVKWYLLLPSFLG